MINWFEQYDTDTFMVYFSNVNYTKYNPLSGDNTFFTPQIKSS